MSQYHNLAGQRNRDAEIKRELIRVGVEPLQLMQPAEHTEVPHTVIGEIKTRHFGTFRFHRAWRYWIVEGLMPLAVAEKIYANPIMKEEARAGGDCGCRKPSTWSKRMREGKVVPSPGELQTVKAALKDGSEIYQMVYDDPKFYWTESEEEFLSYPQFVSTYHIDSELAMYLFVEILKQEGNALTNDEL